MGGVLGFGMVLQWLCGNVPPDGGELGGFRVFELHYVHVTGKSRSMQFRPLLSAALYALLKRGTWYPNPILPSSQT